MVIGTVTAAFPVQCEIAYGLMAKFAVSVA